MTSNPNPSPDPDGDKAVGSCFGWCFGIFGGLIGLIVLLFVVGSFFSSDDDDTGSADNPFDEIYQACSEFHSAIQYQADARRMIVDGAMAEGAVDDTAERAVGCLLGASGAPNEVQTAMLNTRAIDGAQSDSWLWITATWTYHPDDGLRVTFDG